MLLQLLLPEQHIQRQIKKGERRKKRDGAREREWHGGPGGVCVYMCLVSIILLGLSSTCKVLIKCVCV